MNSQFIRSKFAVIAIIDNSGAAIELRQSKYLNNLVEQDHRAIKRIVRPMLGFKDFDCARRLIAGIEAMHMVLRPALSEGDRPTMRGMLCPTANATPGVRPNHSLGLRPRPHTRREAAGGDEKAIPTNCPKCGALGRASRGFRGINARGVPLAFIPRSS